MAENYSSIQKVAVFGSVHKQGFAKACTELLQTLETYGVELFLDERMEQFLRANNAYLPSAYQLIKKDDAVSVHLALSLGGDGTFLKTAKSNISVPKAPPLQEFLLPNRLLQS